MWPFLPPLSPFTRQTGGVLCGVLPELITWAGAKTNYLKDHSEKAKLSLCKSASPLRNSTWTLCKQHENHYIVQCAWYRPLWPFPCLFGNLGSPYLALTQISHRHLTGHYLYPTCSIIQEAHKTNANGKLSHLHLLTHIWSTQKLDLNFTLYVAGTLQCI